MNADFGQIIKLYQELPETKGDLFKIVARNAACSKLRDAVSELTDDQRKAFVAEYGELAKQALRTASPSLPARGW